MSKNKEVTANWTVGVGRAGRAGSDGGYSWQMLAGALASAMHAPAAMIVLAERSCARKQRDPQLDQGGYQVGQNAR